MNVLISKTQEILISENIKKSVDPNRFEIVANKVIDFMDENNLKTIPRYRFLQKQKTTTKDGLSWNTLLGKYLSLGEYDSFVKPLIRQKRTDFTYSTNMTVGANSYHLDDNVAVKSLGEVIVYNTFKMNNIKLKYEDPKKSFYYIKSTDEGDKIYKKIPDFYWQQKDLFIEVAGLRDQKQFGVDYLKKLDLAKSEVEKTGSDMIILDYFTYKDNPQGFYEYVCKEFGFKYEPDNFWLSISYEGLDEKKYLEKVKNIISKGGDKTRGEQDMLKKIVTRYLTKPNISIDGENKPIGYKSVKQFKRETGFGLKFGDEQLRKMAQIAWCESSGSNIKTYEKFKELFGEKEKMSKNTLEKMKSTFPNEFDMSKRDEICSNVSI